MKLTFWGATRHVTGSMFLLEIEDYKILIDCGLDVGRERMDEPDPNAYEPAYPGAIFPFDASTLSAVLLTHAHIDHTGMIPNLFRDGFDGMIYTSAPSRDLSEILLYDSANLNRKKAKTLSGKKGKKAEAEADEASKTLYFEHHVQEAMEHFQTVPLDKPIKLADGIVVTYITTGHLLGAASLFLEATINGERKTIGFSGDLGRKNYPLLKDPSPFPECDYLVCESTYGSRKHKDNGDPSDLLADIIKRTCVDIPGRLLIPAFSVGRTQAILFTLNRLYSERGFEPIKVFSDSPLALQSTKIYTKHAHLLNDQAREFKQRHNNLFDFQNFEYVADPEKSKALSDYNEPCIIVSSSGMIKGGRIEYHVRRNLENPYASIYIVGFAPEGTLSHALTNGLELVKNDGKEYKVQANIEKTDIFSGHADVSGLLHFVKQQNPVRLKKLFLVHGDYQSMLDFQQVLNKEQFSQVELPQTGAEYTLD